MAMTRGQAAAAVAEATAERDSIQTNLLDLDGSFGKQMLAGTTLTGESKLRWEAAATDLATLWGNLQRLRGGPGQSRRAHGRSAPHVRP